MTRSGEIFIEIVTIFELNFIEFLKEFSIRLPGKLFVNFLEKLHPEKSIIEAFP
jgi:hypothetical protein